MIAFRNASTKSTCLSIALSAALQIITLPAMAFVTGEDQNPDPNGNPPENCLYSLNATQFEAVPATVEPGQNSTFHWSIDDPTGNCSGTSFWLISNEVGSVLSGVAGDHLPASGSLVLPQASSASWTLRARRYGTDRDLATLSTTAELPLPKCVEAVDEKTGQKTKVCPDVHITDSSAADRQLLERALLEGGRTVILDPNVDMDMTGHFPTIVGGTTLKGGRDSRNPGPRLYTTHRLDGNTNPLLNIRCDGPFSGDNVTLSGFRLEGPHLEQMDGDAHLEKGILITSCLKTEISNMEISGWSGEAIYVQDPDNRNHEFSDIKISNNFIHHNLHFDGFGYGVSVSHGARVLIERNVFDFNRHAIEASGNNGPANGQENSLANGTGYTARENLVLKGGGYHRSETWPHKDWYTHQFDVHGTLDCYDVKVAGLYNAGCGQAGDNFDFDGNTFQYTRGNAIKMRGHPTTEARVRNNVFAHGSPGDAVKQNPDRQTPPFGTIFLNINHPIIFANNQFSNSYGKYGVCDFDGDGTDDLFMATGVSWWYSSGGQKPWTFLKAATERLTDVGLGYFDDKIGCDVLAGSPLEISSGGNSAWETLPGNHLAPMNELRFGDFTGDGKTDIFRRDQDGQWWILSPNTQPDLGWVAANSSGIALKDLRFGNFDNIPGMDVIAVQSGRWSISSGGQSAWAQLNSKLGNSLTNKIVIGDINDNGIDDIINYNLVRTGLPNANNGYAFKLNLTASLDGRGNWISLGSQLLPPGAEESYCAAITGCAWDWVQPLVGRFLGTEAGSRMLVVDRSRNGLLYNFAGKTFDNHSLVKY